VLLGSTAFGIYKGMAWQIASLTSLVLSYFVALKFSGQLAPHLGQEEPLNRIGAMLVLYVITSLVVWILFRLVAKAIDRVKLKEFDHQIGGLMGAAKGVLYCVVVTFFAVFLSAESRDRVLESRSGHYIAVLIDRVDPILPPEARETLGPYLQKLDEQLDPATPHFHRLDAESDPGDALLNDAANRLDEAIRLTPVEDE
jgi:membrane protein required for colicin V production